jgi:hypothetical protein
MSELFSFEQAKETELDYIKLLGCQARSVTTSVKIFENSNTLLKIKKIANGNPWRIVLKIN